MGRGGWQAIAHGVTKSQTQLNRRTHTHTHSHTHTHTGDSQLKVGTTVLCGQT